MASSRRLPLLAALLLLGLALLSASSSALPIVLDPPNYSTARGLFDSFANTDHTPTPLPATADSGDIVDADDGVADPDDHTDPDADAADDPDVDPDAVADSGAEPDSATGADDKGMDADADPEADADADADSDLDDGLGDSDLTDDGLGDPDSADDATDDKGVDDAPEVDPYASVTSPTPFAVTSPTPFAVTSPTPVPITSPMPFAVTSPTPLAEEGTPLVTGGLDGDGDDDDDDGESAAAEEPPLLAKATPAAEGKSVGSLGGAASTGGAGFSVVALVGIALAILAPAVLIYWAIRRRNSGFENMPAVSSEANTYRGQSVGGTFSVGEV